MMSLSRLFIWGLPYQSAKSPARTHPLIAPINNALIDLPAPTNISYMWNFGSLLGLCLTMQIVSGLMLSMHYTPNIEFAFDSLANITRDVNNGWLLRNIHANGGSLFFICLYTHMARGIYFNSYTLRGTWTIGTTIFILSMATAFMGYLLPWGQMSFWGATVITNLFSAIPYVGPYVVEWIWGGFSVNNATLVRFFSLHFLAPFLILAFTIIHLIFLHQTGSSNPLGFQSNSLKTPFHPHFTTKDTIGFLLLLTLSAALTFYYPTALLDPENFIPANPLVTPTHIKPEWYFLWAYAILRAVPNKLGGVVLLFSALLMFYLLPLLANPSNTNSSISQFRNWAILATFLLLTWLGGSPVEPPYDVLGQIVTFTYFALFATVPL